MLKKLATRVVVLVVAILPFAGQPLPAVAASGGTLFAITGINQSILSRIDPATGAETPIVDLAGPDQGQVGSIAGDPATHRIFGLRTSVVFIPPSNINITNEIVTVNDQTGTFTVSPAISFVNQALAFDQATGTLYGIGFNNAVYRINPSSGATTLVANLNVACCGILAMTLVPGGHTLYVGDSTETPSGPFSHTVQTVDTTSGAVTTSPSADGRLGYLTYDTSSKLLLTNDIFSLFSVDPATGLETTIGTYNTDPNAIFTFAGAVDSNSNTAFVHIQTLDSSFNVVDELFSVNDQTGAVTPTPPINDELWSLYFEAPAPAITPDSIIADVKAALAGGQISNSGVATALLAELNQAKAARATGGCVTASRVYGAFVNNVSAQSGKSIDAGTASHLVSEAQFLITNCP